MYHGRLPMHAEEIELQHEPMIRKAFDSLHPDISDFTFANLFLFREIWRYRLARNGHPIVTCEMEDREPCWMPLSDLRQMERADLIGLMEEHGAVFPVPEEWLRAFGDPAFSVSCSAGEMDYVYRMEKMATFRGGRLNRKRNHLKQFLTLYRHDSRSLTAGRRDDALAVLEAWQAEAGLSKSETDYGPCLEALHLLERLRLNGMIYYAEKQPVGFLIGERLNRRVFVIHFAKGIKTYKGLYEYMFNDAAKRLISRYEYLNLEEDLGKEALRITKSSYDPDSMVKKYRIRLNKG